MKILITGGAGFIGSHIVDRLINTGYEVYVLDNLSTGKYDNVNPKAIFYEMDVCDSKLESIFQEQSFDYVIHQAAQIDVRYSVANPHIDARTNIMGILNILQNCDKTGVKGIIFASSGGAIYGEPKELPVVETYPKGPLSPYGVSKLTSEYYLYYYARVLGLPYFVLRYANVFGPRQNPNSEAGVVAIFGHKMLQGEIPIIFGDGEQLRDYVYVDDVARANLLALEALSREGRKLIFERAGTLDDHAFNISTGKGTSVNELFIKIKGITGFNKEAKHGPERQGELRRIFLDFNKAKKYFKWTQETNLGDGLRITMQYLRNPYFN